MKYKTLLNVRTEYTFLNSLIKIKDYIAFAKQNNLKYLAISDFKNMHGVMLFYKLCKDNDIYPIISLNLNLKINDKIYNVNLIAQNNLGYLNLCKISSYVLNNVEIIELNNFDGLFNNLFFIFNLNQQFSNDFIISFFIQNKQIKNLFFGITQETNLKLLASFKNPEKLIFNYEINYLNFDEYESYCALSAIKRKVRFTDLKKIKLKNYLTLDDIKFLISQEYTSNIDYILNNCYIDNISQNSKHHIFKFKNNFNLPNFQYLKKMCNDRLSKISLNNDLKIQYIKRLNYELDVIKKMQFIDYFLIVWDYVNFAKKNQIMVGPGRGSAPSSLVAYLLNITTVDPIKYNLLFERFLNVQRNSMPDIDIDFCDKRRNEVLEYIADKYDNNHFANIVTFQKIGFKLAIRDVGRILVIDKNIIDNIATSVNIKDNFDYDLVIKNSKFIKIYLMKYPKLFSIMKKIIGLPRQCGTHAAGSILTDTPLTDLLPIQTNAFGFSQSQYSMEFLEDLGIIKMDLLGLKTLNILSNIMQRIIKTDNINFTLDTINLNDNNVFKLLTRGLNFGIFQFESSGMKNILMKIGLNNFNDIVAAIALYRPGPIENIDKYIYFKKNSNQINYLDKSLKDILSKTYGILIFQEQIMLIANKVANFTLNEADILRSAISKKEHNKMLSVKKLFFDGGIQNHYSLSKINKIWDLIYKFADYGFNKAHAVSYSLISYRLAYLKYYFSNYFYEEMLNNFSNIKQKMQLCIQEMNYFNITLVHPSIYAPISKFRILDKNRIIMPLNYNNKITHRFLKLLSTELHLSKFSSIWNFVTRIGKEISKDILEFLIHSGSLDMFDINRTQLFKNIDIIMNYINLVKNLSKDQIVKINISTPKLIEYKENYLEIANFENQYLGFNLIYDPIKLAKSNLKFEQNVNLINLAEIDNVSNNCTYSILTKINKITQIKDKNNNDMAFLNLSDGLNQIEIVVFHHKFNDYKTKIKVNDIGIFEIYKNTKKSYILNSFNYIKI